MHNHFPQNILILSYLLSRLQNLGVNDGFRFCFDKTGKLGKVGPLHWLHHGAIHKMFCFKGKLLMKRRMWAERACLSYGRLWWARPSRGIQWKARWKAAVKMRNQGEKRICWLADWQEVPRKAWQRNHGKQKWEGAERKRTGQTGKTSIKKMKSDKKGVNT